METKKNVDAWRLLSSIAKSEGLTQASIELGIDGAFCSRMLKKLESELEIQLIDHSKRPITLTKQAKRILPQVNRFLFQFNELNLAVEQEKSASVDIRIAIPLNIPRDSTLTNLRSIQSSHKNFTYTVIAECDDRDLLASRCDIGIVPYSIDHPKIHQSLISNAFTGGVASPKYIEKFGAPKNIFDLNHHVLIRRTGTKQLLWGELEKEGQKFPIKWSLNTLQGDILHCKQLALESKGICFDLSAAFIHSEIERGELVPVLPGWHRPFWSLHLSTLKSNFENDLFKKIFYLLLKKERITVRARQKATAEILGWFPPDL